MNTLQSILEEWEKDSIMDKNEPGSELYNIPKLHSKYLNALTRCRLLLKKVKDDLLIERKIRYNYYTGHYNTDKDMLDSLGLEPFKFLLKSDVNLYIDTDDAIIKINSKKAVYEEMVSACELIMGELKSRTYQLRDYINWVKYSEGS